jgi:hypothetical protein
MGTLTRIGGFQCVFLPWRVGVFRISRFSMLIKLLDAGARVALLHFGHHRGFGLQ